MLHIRKGWGLKSSFRWVWWHTPAILVHRRWRQKDQERQREAVLRANWLSASLPKTASKRPYFNRVRQKKGVYWIFGSGLHVLEWYPPVPAKHPLHNTPTPDSYTKENRSRRCHLWQLCNQSKSKSCRLSLVIQCTEKSLSSTNPWKAVIFTLLTLLMRDWGSTTEQCA